jgi:DNA ligase-1
MAKRLDSVAKFDRGPDLLKIKLFFEDEFKIVDFYEGNGKLKGSLGGIIVEGKINWGLPGKPRKEYNIRSKCGSGFDEDLRQEIWDNRKKWLGAVVQIQFQEATKKNSLQFPVFIMRRKDKE